MILHALFVYGTLKDEEICELLFKDKISSEPAVLYNYTIKKSSDFFFITTSDKHVVEGKVIYLTDNQLLIADQWEEIPYYTRKKVEVNVSDKIIDAWVYVRENADGEEADSNQISSIDRNEVINQIRSFNRQLELNSLPFTDAYFLIPGTINTRKLLKNKSDLDFEANFIEKIDEISVSEYNGTLGKQINRYHLPQIDIAAYSSDDTEILGFEKASIVISEFNETGFAVIYIIVPAVSVPLIYILDQASSNRIRVRELDEDKFISISEYFLSKGINTLGTIRTALFMKEPPSENDMISTLICEAGSSGKITGKRILTEINNNIAQYSSADIFASDICIIEISKHFDLSYENRLNGQLLTLFILELIQLQEAALTKVSNAIFSMIVNKTYVTDTLALKKMEELTEEYSKAMLLWNIHNFKYRTAQSLADEFSSKFRMEKRFEEFFQYKTVLEQLTSIHANRINISESKILNSILLILAFIQIAPILNNIYQLIYTSQFEVKDIFTSLTSVVSCFMIWLIFRYINKKSS